jgi:hypothetical protein
MDTIIVYIDDATYAGHQLAPMRDNRHSTHWVLVACAPRMTHRIGKWVSHGVRENWRTKWADKLFRDIAPQLWAQGDTVSQVLAKDPLVPLTERLVREHGASRVLDARRPKFGQDMAPVTRDQPPPDASGYRGVPGAVAGLGAMLLITAD